jgi:hypothetical protein
MANSYTRTLVETAGRYVIDSKAGRSFGEAQANMVVQRTREMGIRMALESSVGQAMLQIGRSIVGASLLGVVLGLVLSAGALRVMRSELYGVGVYDVTTILLVVLTIFRGGTSRHRHSCAQDRQHRSSQTSARRIKHARLEDHCSSALGGLSLRANPRGSWNRKNRHRSRDAKNCDDPPCQIIAVLCIKHFAHKPWRRPLADGITHNDQRKQLA